MAEEPEPSFEDALTRIERIVESLERGEPSLSIALARYEDGVQLLRRCYDLLDQAERSVALLTGVDEHGQPTTAAFDATATQARELDPSTPATAGNDARPTVLDRKSKPRSRIANRDPSEVPDVPF
jgi:exodeoxyribonuclease VII small subunit